ncbi:DNA starvation/stationary phase protection protein [Gymnodinialimonas sp. 57CJ19]|uniref:Dps family protein n=1 Tax=Gymnodinialimonas sp. 57CJ19 TaxID=3138498 RepID=UPI003134441D
MTTELNRNAEDAVADISNVKSVTDALSEVLSDTYRLILKTQTYHWNVMGPLFHPVHVMTEEQYTDMFAAVDELAERIRALGKPAVVNPTALSAGPDGTHPDATLPATDMVKDLASDHEALARRLRALVDTAEDARDPVTADLATVRATFHEKAAWMLNATAA